MPGMLASPSNQAWYRSSAIVTFKKEASSSESVKPKAQIFEGRPLVSKDAPFMMSFWRMHAARAQSPT
eukprot:14380371-Alexandrium_andersonii.AAC.1